MPKPRTIVALEDIPDDPVVEGIAKRFLERFHQYQEYSELEKFAKENKSEASQLLLGWITELEVNGLDVEGFRLAISKTSSSRIIKERLLERGVSPDVIQYATQTTESKPFLKVSRLAESRNGESS